MASERVQLHNWSMGTCWAACLGDCCGKLSREHVVSRSLFLGEQVSAHGFAWCKAEPKVVGLSSLTAKILCRKHNSDLSGLDSTAAKAFEAMREMMRLSNVRSGLKPRIWQVQRYQVDGPKLERWFLKTLINLAFEGEYYIGRDSRQGGQPSRTLVDLCFGRTKFLRPAGLYSVVVGQQIRSTDTVSFAPFLIDHKFVSGGLFSFRGFRHFLSLEEAAAPHLPKGIGLPGEDWSICGLNYHNAQAREMGGKHLSQVLETRWPEKDNSEIVVENPR